MAEKLAGLAADLAAVEDLEEIPASQAEALEARFAALAGPSLRWEAENNLEYLPEEPSVWEMIASSVGMFLESTDGPNPFDSALDPSALRRNQWPVLLLRNRIPGIGRRLLVGQWELIADAWAKHVRKFRLEPIDWWGERLRSRDNPWLKVRRELAAHLQSRGLEQSLKAFCFGGFHQEARELVYWLQRGGRNGLGVDVPKYYLRSWRLSLSDRSVEIHAAQRDFRLTEPTLFTVVRQKPYPFGLCTQCDRPFVQKARGKLRRYCSRRCKDAGVPSASKRSEYARTSRQRSGLRDLQTAEAVTRNVPRSRWYEVLQKSFPNKPRDEIRRIIDRLSGATRRGPRKEGVER